MINLAPCSAQTKLSRVLHLTHSTRFSWMETPDRYLDTQKRFPHLANCLKYSMAFTVALFGVFTPPNSTTTAVKV